LYKVLFSMNPTSVLAWMGVFYTIYLVIIVLKMYFAMRGDLYHRRTGLPLPLDAVSRGKRWLFILGTIGIPIVIVVGGGVGAIFAVAKARPNWFSGLFPIIFLVSALASGGGLLTFLSAATLRLAKEQKQKLVQGLAYITVGFVGLDFLLLASEILVTLYGNIPRESVGWKLVLSGPYWWVFWFIQVGFGAAVPTLIVLGRKTRSSLNWLGFAGFAAMVGIIGTRLNIVIPPQFLPAFPTLAESYPVECCFGMGYVPSLHEWLVGLGTIAIGIWFFLLAKRVLPLETRFEPKGVKP
jgi:molybdopterin-containing oxidoreductase family membrane subunit